MSKKRKTVILTPQQIMEWNQSVVAYLRSLLQDEPNLGLLEPALLAPGVLNPYAGDKGDLLLRPGKLMQEAYYLRKGRVKLYSE